MEKKSTISVYSKLNCVPRLINFCSLNKNVNVWLYFSLFTAEATKNLAILEKDLVILEIDVDCCITYYKNFDINFIIRKLIWTPSLGMYLNKTLEKCKAALQLQNRFFSSTIL